MNGRLYDPYLGQFLSADPLAEKYVNVSPYCYALNNPLRYVDPDGNWVRDKDDRYEITGDDMYAYSGYMKDINNGTGSMQNLQKSLQIASQKNDGDGGNMPSTLSDEKAPARTTSTQNKASQSTFNFAFWGKNGAYTRDRNNDYSPYSNHLRAPNGVSLSVGFNSGEGAVGSFGYQVAATGDGLGLWNTPGGGMGHEGISGGISLAFLYSNKNEKISLKDISGNGIQGNASIDMFLSPGVNYGYNSPNLKSVFNKRNSSYQFYGVSIGAGMYPSIFGVSYQTTYSNPILLWKF